MIGKWRRRKPGIYLVRTRKHTSSRRENGYVGLSNNVHMRRLDHLGRGRYGQAAKPWADLDPVWHMLALPWWLGFRWTLAPLETLAIALTAPRYNHQKNLWNPRRVPLNIQKLQRAQRDRGGVVVRRFPVLRLVGLILIIIAMILMKERT